VEPDDYMKHALNRRTLWMAGLAALALPSWAAAQDSSVAARVKKIVIEHLGVAPEKVTDTASFIDDLGADSLDTVELVMAFEEEFECLIPDDFAQTCLTVGDAIKFLQMCKHPATKKFKKSR
jgi:acyl carrier protein